MLCVRSGPFGSIVRCLGLCTAAARGLADSKRSAVSLQNVLNAVFGFVTFVGK